MLRKIVIEMSEESSIDARRWRGRRRRGSSQRRRVCLVLLQFVLFKTILIFHEDKRLLSVDGNPIIIMNAKKTRE
jgi:hypothetical protein